MFRTLVYFNHKKVMEYKSLIERKKVIEFKNATVSTENGFKGAIAFFSGETGGKSELNGDILNNYLLDCEEFENALQERDDYFDLLNYDADTNTIPNSTIIRFTGTFNIPEEFHMLDMLNKFKPFLVNSIQANSTEESEALKSLLGKDSTKVPLFIETEDLFDGRICFSKVNSNNFCCDIESLDEFENEEVTVLAKIVSKKSVNGKSVIVFDVLKDLFSLNRALRRQFDLQPDPNIKNITLDEDYVQLEVLAIYQ